MFVYRSAVAFPLKQSFSIEICVGLRFIGNAKVEEKLTVKRVMTIIQS